MNTRIDLSDPTIRTIIHVACAWLNEQDRPSAHFEVAADKVSARLQADLGYPITLSGKTMKRLFHRWLSRRAELESWHNLFHQCLSSQPEVDKPAQPRASAREKSMLSLGISLGLMGGLLIYLCSKIIAPFLS